MHRLVLDVELHVGIGVQKGDEGFGHDVAERVGYANVQLSREHLLEVVHVVHTRLGGVHGLLGVGEQFLSGLREIHLVGVSLEEGQSYFLLQVRDLLREGALRDVELARCLREVERLGHLQEVFELSYFHCRFCFLFLSGWLPFPSP